MKPNLKVPLHLPPFATPSKYPSRKLLSTGVVLAVGVFFPPPATTAFTLLVLDGEMAAGTENPPTFCGSPLESVICGPKAASACSPGVGFSDSGLTTLAGSMALVGAVTAGDTNGEGFVNSERSDFL